MTENKTNFVPLGRRIKNDMPAKDMSRPKVDLLVDPFQCVTIDHSYAVESIVKEYEEIESIDTCILLSEPNFNTPFSLDLTIKMLLQADMGYIKAIPDGDVLFETIKAYRDEGKEIRSINFLEDTTRHSYVAQIERYNGSCVNSLYDSWDKTFYPVTRLLNASYSPQYIRYLIRHEMFEQWKTYTHQSNWQYFTDLREEMKNVEKSIDK